MIKTEEYVWIPVKERLPKENFIGLVTCIANTDILGQLDGSEMRFVAIGVYITENDQWEVYHPFSIYQGTLKVIAWKNVRPYYEGE